MRSCPTGKVTPASLPHWPLLIIIHTQQWTWCWLSSQSRSAAGNEPTRQHVSSCLDARLINGNRWITKKKKSHANKKMSNVKLITKVIRTQVFLVLFFVQIPWNRSRRLPPPLPCPRRPSTCTEQPTRVNEAGGCRMTDVAGCHGGRCLWLWISCVTQTPHV